VVADIESELHAIADKILMVADRVDVGVHFERKPNYMLVCIHKKLKHNQAAVAQISMPWSHISNVYDLESYFSGLFIKQLNNLDRASY
jgi:hypothetical protein